MTKLVEMDLEFDFSGAKKAYKFDDDEIHAASSAQRVDFVAEYDDCYRFVEVKDLDCPDLINPEAFIKKLKTNELIHKLAGKYRDTKFYRSNCEEHSESLDIDYIVLIARQSLEPALMVSRLDLLHRALPIENINWGRKSVRSCVILNLEQYKKQFGEHSVRRLSDSGA
jgi:hypothetical protein